MGDLRKKLVSICGERVRAGEPLAKHTTFGIGGSADYFVDVSDEKELEKVLRLASQGNIPWFILGFGSNVLVSDEGVRGIILRLAGDFKKLEHSRGAIVAGAAARIQRLVSFAVQAGFEGMECLFGIPGTVGGALIMNAGTREGEISDYLVEVREFRVQSSEFRVLKKKDITFKYRWSSFQKNRDIIVSAKFKFPLAKSGGIVLKRMGGLMRHRQATQPIEMKNAGSIFKNPPGKHAARLIEAAGLKGLKRGDAMVSLKHANFIVNKGRAKAHDILSLMKEIQKIVFERFKVKLEPEIRLIGDFGHDAQTSKS